MRSKSVHVALLLASVSLAACSDEPNKQYGDGMAFESYEDCSVNIGAENCQKEPVKQAAAGQTSNGGTSTHSTTILPIFLPNPGFSGGYRADAPRMSPSYVPSSPAYAATS